MSNFDVIKMTKQCVLGILDFYNDDTTSYIEEHV